MRKIQPGSVFGVFFLTCILVELDFSDLVHTGVGADVQREMISSHGEDQEI